MVKREKEALELPVWLFGENKVLQIRDLILKNLIYIRQ